MKMSPSPHHPSRPIIHVWKFCPLGRWKLCVPHSRETNKMQAIVVLYCTWSWRAPCGLDARRAEELGDEQPARRAAVGVVRRERHVLVPVRQPHRPRRGRPAAAVGVVRPQHLLRRLRRGHHHRRHRAQPQHHHRPVPPRQIPQAPVRQRAQLEQVAQDRQPRWARRQSKMPPATTAAGVPANYQQEGGDWEEEEE